MVRKTSIIIFILISFFWIATEAQAANVTDLSDNRSSYNNNRIPLYNKFELSFNLDSAYTNPFNPSQIKVDAYFSSPTGKELVQPGFYYQEYNLQKDGSGNETYTPVGSASWKIRFSPQEIGQYSYYIKVTDSHESTNTPALTVDAVDSNNPGFIRVSQNNNRYFAFEKGGSFFGNGLNIGWFGESNQTKRLSFFQDFFNQMSVHKANLVRIWMLNSERHASWVIALQDQVAGGNYNSENAWILDQMLETAAQKNIYIMLTIDSMTRYTDGFTTSNLFSVNLGGPLNYPAEVFTNSTAIDYYKRLYRYLIARWSFSPNIFCWQLFNEINAIKDADPGHFNETDMLNWHSQMGNYFEDTDPYHHLVGTSTYAFNLYPALFGLSQMNMINMHMYYVPGWPYAPSDPQGRDMADLTRYYTYEMLQSVTGKPGVIDEHGILDSSWDNSPYVGPNAPHDDSGIHLHNSLWSALMSGTATTTLSWHWPEHKYFGESWWSHYLGIANYFNGIDTNGLQPARPVNISTVSDSYPDTRATELSVDNNHIRILALKKGTDARYLWVQNIDHTWWNYVNSVSPANQTGSITVSALRPSASYQYELWNTYSGSIQNTSFIMSNANGALQIPITALQTDLAIKLYLNGTLPTSTPSPTPTLTSCNTLGDVDKNCMVNSQDLQLVLANWLGSGSCSGFNCNLNGDGKINALDAVIVLANFGK